MSDFFAIPFKRTLSFDFRKALTSVIDNTFYQTAASVENDLIALDDLRDKLFHLDVSDVSLQLLIRYYLALKEVSSKLPDDQIEFTWFNTLGLKSSGMTRNSLQFETWNVLYNIGAMYSLQAVDRNLKTSDGLREACFLFKLAAGSFQRLLNDDKQNNLQFMDEYTLQALVSIMLAQGQETVWTKAFYDSKERHSVLSRLALQAALLYEDAARFSNTSPLIKTDWVKSLRCKSEYFRAVAYFRSAQLQLEKSNYAQGICDFKVVLKCLKKISATESLSEWRKEVESVLESTERDNDLIYLQPTVQTPSAIKPVLMVSPAYFDDIDNKDETIFRNLLPVDVIESCNALNDRIHCYIRDHILKPVEALNKILQENVPQIEQMTTQSLSKEEWKSYLDSFEDLEQLRGHVLAELKAAELLLSKDYAENEQMIRKHGSMRWSLLSKSEELTSLEEDLNKIRSFLDKGLNVDAETKSLFNTLDHDLVTAITEPPESNDPVLKEAISLIKERKEFTLMVERKVLQNRLLPKIISHYKKTKSVDFEQVYQDHVKMFDEDLARVQAEKEKNRDTISKITASQPAQKRVNRVDPRMLHFEELKHSFKVLEEVKQNIASGKQFYNDLIKALETKRHVIDEYVQRQKTMREDLNRELCSGTN